MSNNDFSIPDDEQNGPSSQLDIYSEALSSTVNDEMLEEINLGLGNYSNSEHWQQVDSFKQGLYADVAFSRRLEERAIQEAKRELGRQGYRFWDENKDEYRTFDGWDDFSDRKQDRKDPEEHGERIWEKLPEKEQTKAIMELTGFKGLDSPHWRMMMMRHESSRSKNARLLDNLFGRVKEVKDETAEAVKQRLG